MRRANSFTTFVCQYLEIPEASNSLTPKGLSKLYLLYTYLLLGKELGIKFENVPKNSILIFAHRCNKRAVSKIL